MALMTLRHLFLMAVLDWLTGAIRVSVSMGNTRSVRGLMEDTKPRSIVSCKSHIYMFSLSSFRIYIKCSLILSVLTLNTITAASFINQVDVNSFWFKCEVGSCGVMGIINVNLGCVHSFISIRNFHAN